MSKIKNILNALLISGLLLTGAFANETNTAAVLKEVESRSQVDENVGFKIVQVADGVYAAMGGDEGPAENNAGFIVGTNGVVVVDTFEDITPARNFLAAIRRITNLPIRYVVNTHYHLDHVGGNSVFAEAGATILAHRNVRSWERVENLKFFGNDPKPEKRAYVEAFALPDSTYTDAVDIYLGNRLVQVRHMLGHTGGDSVVIVPSAKNYRTDIVFGGDLVWQKHIPNLIDASTDLWIKTLDKLITERPTAVFIPGHGDLANVEDVRDFRNYLAAVRKEVEQAQKDGKSENALNEAVLAKLKTIYGQWGFFEYFAKRNITQTDAELKGKKRIPLAVKD